MEEVPTMSFKLIVPIIALVLIGCKNEKEVDSIDPKAIEGEWKLVRTSTMEEVPGIETFNQSPDEFPPREGIPFEYLKVPDLIIENDSIHFFYYPVEFLSGKAFSIDTQYLSYEGQWGTRTFPLRFEDDTLFLYDFEEGWFLEEVYARATFDDSIISVLKKDSINYAMLEGKWVLYRDYFHNYGTHYVLDFPHEIPDSLELTRKEILSTLDTDKSILMKTDGEYKKYYLGYSSFYDELHLKPGPWYKGEDPWIHFDRKENHIY